MGTLVNVFVLGERALDWARDQRARVERLVLEAQLLRLRLASERALAFIAKHEAKSSEGRKTPR